VPERLGARQPTVGCTSKDLEQLRALTRALEEAGYLERDGGRLELTPRAARKLGMRALTEIFSKLRRDSFGGHALPRSGFGGEPTDESKPLEFGDPFAIDLNRTLFNAMTREGPGTPMRISPDDFEVHRSEETTVSSTVLLLDMSRSMLLRGWLDRRQAGGHGAAHADPHQVPARPPVRGRLRVLRAPDQAGGDRHALALRVRVRHQPAARADHRAPAPRTAAPAATRRSWSSPTANPPRTSPTARSNSPIRRPIRTMQSTLREVGRATKEGIVINTFMLERSRYLSEFVDLMSRINRGRAF